uniref:Bardet-Biedl syndrome 12 n=1 Tax=Amphilophus citrinellus TaxID=61819 RepID=A0A3Q0SNU5_AMPCI
MFCLHVGLQKLLALAGVSHSLLGPYKKYKFIQDDESGDSALVCSCFRIIETLELTCAVGQLVYETIQAHQKVYHTGSGCLLFLAGAWSRAALECLQRGISVAHIVSAMSEGMDVCLDACRKCAVSIEGLGVMPLERFAVQLPEEPIADSSRALCSVQGTIKETLKISEQRKIKLSRHFCETKTENVSTVLLQSPQPKLLDIVHIAEGLSHGCDDAMKLVVKAGEMQSKSNQEEVSYSVFDISKVVTCVLPGLPEDHACVVVGCVVLLSAEQASVAHQLKEQHLKVVLLNGDLSHTYRHLGFNRPAGIHRVSDQTELSSSSKEDEWVEQIVTHLLNLEVNLILINGHACEKVIQRCCRHRVLVVENVKGSVLKTFANLTGVVPLTYATQLSKHNVGTGAKIAIWKDLSSHDWKSLAVNISTGRNSGLVTVILTSCIHGKLQALEDQFWACAYRLHYALKDRALLPGAGGTEMFCIHRLQKRAEYHVMHHREKPGETDSNRYRSVVLDLMAEGLIDYRSTVMVNTGRMAKVKARTAVSQQLQDYNRHPDNPAESPQLLLDTQKEEREVFTAPKPGEARAVEIYDNLSVKQEAWRKALDLVLLVLQTDAEIITEAQSGKCLF